MIFEDWAVEILPAFLRGPWGRKWGAAVGLMADTIRRGVRDAIKAGLIATAPDDAVPFIASDRTIDRGRGETLAAFRLRIAKWWETAQLFGTKAGIEQALEIWGPLSGVNLYSWVEGWNDSNATNNGRFWIGIEGHTWQPRVAGDNEDASEEALAGITMVLSELRELRRIVHKWRAGHELGVAFIVAFGVSLNANSLTPGVDLATNHCDLPIGRFFNYPYGEQAGESTICGYYIDQ